MGASVKTLQQYSPCITFTFWPFEDNKQFQAIKTHQPETNSNIREFMRASSHPDGQLSDDYGQSCFEDIMPSTPLTLGYNQTIQQAPWYPWQRWLSQYQGFLWSILWKQRHPKKHDIRFSKKAVHFRQNHLSFGEVEFRALTTKKSLWQHSLNKLSIKSKHCPIMSKKLSQMSSTSWIRSETESSKPINFTKRVQPIFFCIYRK